MFLLKCEADNSIVIMQDVDVIFEDSVKVKDKVKFMYRGKEWAGVVMARSDDEAELKSLQKTLTKNENKKSDENKDRELPHKRKSKTKERYSPDHAQETVAKRIKKRETSKAKDSSIKKVKNSALRKLLQANSDESSSDNDLLVKVANEERSIENKQQLIPQKNACPAAVQYSPSKEELKLMIRALQQANPGNSLSHAQLHLFQSPSDKSVETIGNTQEDTVPQRADPSSDTCNNVGPAEDVSLESDAEDGDNKDMTEDEDGVIEGEVDNKPESEDKKPTQPTDINKLAEGVSSARYLDQLYGKNYEGEEMVLLRDGIYCQKKALTRALGAASKNATHFLRKIILGIFKESAFKNATLTGTAPRAAGRVPDPSVIVPLDQVAVAVIIKYTKAVAKTRPSWPPTTTHKLMQAFTQRVGEIKRELK